MTEERSHKELLARHQAVMPSWLALYYEQPIEIVSGSGRRVVDGEGRTYLDFFAGILTNSLGYDVAEVREAIASQLATGVMHTSTVYLIRRQVELAERIAALSGIDDAKVFFTNSGTEANETALMLAAQYRRSNQVLAMRNSYHGRAFATVAITANRGWSASSLSPLQTAFLHGGYRYRSPFRSLSDAAFIDACVEDLRDVIATSTAGDVACLIAEPIQGVGGFATPPDGLFGALQAVLDEYGILFVSDEVQTGWGRTGSHFWGYQAHGARPHALTFAKGLGNGLAIGGVVAQASLMDCFTANSLSTFGGNPVATSGALAVLDYIRDHDLQANAEQQGTRLLSGLRHLADARDMIGEVRGKGLMVGVELVAPGTRDPAATAAARFQELARSRGLLVGKGGLYGNVLRIAPPLTVTTEEIDEALAIIADTLAAMA
ncbi:aspartate aminotransferase family protein [Flindersiella endophytica]